MANASDSSAFQRLSAPLLLRLAALPRWALVVGIAALAVAGMLLDGWPGALLLVILACFLGWLAVLGWGRLGPLPRLLRAATLGLLLAFALSKVL